MARPTIDDILAWADAHFQRTRSWPRILSGKVHGAAGRTWMSINEALRRGIPGVGKSSLAELLSRRRGVPNPKRLPRLEEPQILLWAGAHYARTGTWPTNKSGIIDGVPGESWNAVHVALQQGHRGLPGGSSLPRLLAGAGRRRNRRAPPQLTLQLIGTWAWNHARRTGEWPTRLSGPVPEAPGESWTILNDALKQGRRGLPAGFTLSRLIHLYRNWLLEPDPKKSLDEICRRNHLA